MLKRQCWSFSDQRLLKNQLIWYPVCVWRKKPLISTCENVNSETHHKSMTVHNWLECRRAYQFIICGGFFFIAVSVVHAHYELVIGRAHGFVYLFVRISCGVIYMHLNVHPGIIFSSWFIRQPVPWGILGSGLRVLSANFSSLFNPLEILQIQTQGSI